MSSKAEMSSGLVGGVYQGYKTGFGFSKMESGFRKGLLNGIRKHDKVQDPTTMSGSRLAKMFWVADTFPEPTPGSLVASGAFPNLVGSATLTAAGNPARRKGVGDKWYIDFDNASDLISSSSITGTRELTVFLVFRPSFTAVADTTLFSRLNNAINSMGDITVFITGSNKIAVRMNSAASTSTNFVRYETPVLRDYSLINGVKNGLAENEFILLAVKFDMNRGVAIPQRDIEIYINGTRSPLTLINNTWNLEYAPPTSNGANMADNACHFGNGAGGTNPASTGTHVASGLVFDYWLSNAEQLRIENFYRYYYGLRF
jgi:hypothetical protein